MLIGVTGGTGYIGAHCVRLLLAEGHRVRLLVAPDVVGAPVLSRFAESGEIVLAGDVRDTAVIDQLLDGCDALIHGAGVVGTDNRRRTLMWEVNAYATESVLTRAVKAGLDPVVSAAVCRWSTFATSPESMPRC
jgi:nucleoside-diphosphate-sugar epimerase